MEGATAGHWTHRQSVAVARPDTTLIPPRTQYGAIHGKAEKGNHFRYRGLASRCNPLQRLTITRNEQVSDPSLPEWTLLQPTATGLVQASTQRTKEPPIPKSQ